jgi:hypothetical protein
MEGVICQGNKISTIILIFKCKTKDRMKPISFNTIVIDTMLQNKNPFKELLSARSDGSGL